jgi:hypothetical protein
MKSFLAAVAMALVALPVGAEDAAALLQRVTDNRPAKDISLKGRLFPTREKFVPVEILLKILPAETRTIYRGGATELLVVQPLRGAAKYYLKGKGELTGEARLGKLLDSHFTFYDLALPYLRWPDPKLVGEERSRGRDCHLVEVTGTNQPYARVKLWIDKEYAALLRAEAFNENGDPVRRFSVSSFRKVDDIWIPGGMEAAFVPAGQALPAQERSRLEIFDGNYDAKLPAEKFDERKFAPTGN